MNYSLVLNSQIWAKSVCLMTIMKVFHYRNEDDDSVIIASETMPTYDGLSFSKGKTLAIYLGRKFLALGQ
jgi:hypothetical protein